MMVWLPSSHTKSSAPSLFQTIHTRRNRSLEIRNKGAILRAATPSTGPGTALYTADLKGLRRRYLSDVSTRQCEAALATVRWRTPTANSVSRAQTDRHIHANDDWSWTRRKLIDVGGQASTVWKKARHIAPALDQIRPQPPAAQIGHRSPSEPSPPPPTNPIPLHLPPPPTPEWTPLGIPPPNPRNCSASRRPATAVTAAASDADPAPRMRSSNARIATTSASTAPTIAPRVDGATLRRPMPRHQTSWLSVRDSPSYRPRRLKMPIVRTRILLPMAPAPSRRPRRAR